MLLMAPMMTESFTLPYRRDVVAVPSGPVTVKPQPAIAIVYEAGVPGDPR